jgi:hypothetical protein
MNQNEVDATKVINSLTLKVAELTQENAILTAQLETLTESKDKKDKK